MANLSRMRDIVRLLTAVAQDLPVVRASLRASPKENHKKQRKLDLMETQTACTPTPPILDCLAKRIASIVCEDHAKCRRCQRMRWLLTSGYLKTWAKKQSGSGGAKTAPAPKQKRRRANDAVIRDAVLASVILRFRDEGRRLMVPSLVRCYNAEVADMDKVTVDKVVQHMRAHGVKIGAGSARRLVVSRELDFFLQKG